MQATRPPKFAIRGDGPETETLIERARQRGVAGAVHFIGHGRPGGCAARGDGVRDAVMARIVPLRRARGDVGRAADRLDHVGGVREAIADGRDGMLVAPADSAALATATVMMLDDRDLRTRLGAAARDRVTRKFTRREMLAG